MKYKLERVRYNDGTKSPFWMIGIYKNGVRFDESPQYSSFWYAFWEWMRVTILF